ncbi:MAG TPA: alpha/beta hydrolase [Candidatus Limnocylindrales bacterium]|nr:alpha/beta hydrolase [Candidatus Limnocylindrales bacterium]
MRAQEILTPPLGTFVPVAGLRLFVDRRGTGDPAVVFLPGAGLTGLDYWPLRQRAGEGRTSVVYDRAGTGYSEQVRLPRTAAAVTDELHQLLATLGIKRAVLVGHSLGGLYARHYANRFPDQTTGLVLLDPAHESYDAYMPAELTAKRQSNKAFAVLNAVTDIMLSTRVTKAALGRIPMVRRYQALYRDLFSREMADWPEDLATALVERHVSLDWLTVGLREARKLDDLYAEVRDTGPMPDIPLVILCSMSTDGFQDAVSMGQSPDLVRQEIAAKLRLYTDITADLARAQVRPVDGGHVTLAFRNPDAVLTAIDDVSR